MSDDQFTKLFKYIKDEFEQVRSDMQHLTTRIDRVHDLVDEDLKRREADDLERVVMNRQLDRHEAWIERASAKLDIKYDRAA